MAKMINKIYTNMQTLKEMSSAFKMQGGILVLGEFLDRSGNKHMLDFQKKKGKQLFRGDLFSYESIDGETFISSREFQEFVEMIVGKKLKLTERANRKFKHKDFTLIHDEAKQNKRIVAIYTSTKNWNGGWGGQSVFTKGDGNPFIFPVANNSLIIIECKKEDYEFTKYINNKAGKNSFLQVKSVFE